MTDPHITDNDKDGITATVDGREVRSWYYRNDAERRIKMMMAHEFAEGWFQAAQHSRKIIDAAMQRLNESGTGEMGVVDTIHATHAILAEA